MIKTMKLLTLAILVYPLVGCISFHEPFQADPQIENSMHWANEYLEDCVFPNGKFAYSVNSKNNTVNEKKYNLIRHAGAIYSMCQYNIKSPKRAQVKFVDRAVGFLKKNIYIANNNKDFLALWTNKKISGREEPQASKLGGNGLALTALAFYEEVKPRSTNIDYLRKIGNFILFMQKKDGSFYPKYIPAAGGLNDKFYSLYYPGEASLGLVKLYGLDQDPKWLNGSIKAMTYLADTRKGKKFVPADHWALIATGEILSLDDKVVGIKIPRKKLINHAKQICQSMIDWSPNYNKNTYLYGCLYGDGRICPTATRLEGLIAIFPYLPREDKELRKKIAGMIVKGTTFLVNSQYKKGIIKGGFPRIAGGLKGESNPIRIDYVQHSLTALIGYLDNVEQIHKFAEK